MCSPKSKGSEVVSRGRPRAVHLGLPLLVAVGVVSQTSLLPGAVRGTVRNATSGQPAGGVMLTLSSFKDGMTPVDETTSAADGRFAFEKELPTVADRQPFLGAIRAEHDGVGYTEILRSGASLEDIQIIVYSARTTNLPAPLGRVVILEPGDTALIVRDNYQFVNDSEPPVTYSSESGTLRFFLPPAAQGQVQVSGMGPARMSLPSTALPSDEPDIFKVDFPLKPGQNSLDLTYVVPHAGATQLTLRTLYRGVPTRVAVPEDVQLTGDIRPLSAPTEARASIYEISDQDVVVLEVTGQGSFPRQTADASPPPAEVTVEPAPVAAEILWIITISALILGLGFFHLLTSKRTAGRPAFTDGPSKG